MVEYKQANQATPISKHLYNKIGYQVFTRYPSNLVTLEKVEYKSQQLYSITIRGIFQALQVERSVDRFGTAISPRLPAKDEPSNKLLYWFSNLPVYKLNKRG